MERQQQREIEAIMGEMQVELAKLTTMVHLLALSIEAGVFDSLADEPAPIDPDLPIVRL